MFPITEREWLESGEATEMLRFLQERFRSQYGRVLPDGSFPFVRKVALFECACCRHIQGRLTDVRSREALEVFERFIEGEASEEEWGAARVEARAVVAERTNFAYTPSRTPSAYPVQAALAVACLSGWLFENTPGPLYSRHAVTDHVLEAVPCNFHRLDEYYRELPDVPRLLRDVFGNPFRPVAFDPGWRTPNVLAVARGLYQERQFEDIPVLGDALEEAGCVEEEVLTHCRRPGVHVRGCWLVDLILGRE